MITFSRRESRRLLHKWQRHYPQLRLSYEPTYNIGRHYPTLSLDGKPLLLTAWKLGKPTIMPPADVVSVSLYDDTDAHLRTFLIGQPELFELLGSAIETESLPTPYFRLESLTDDLREQVITQGTLVDSRPIAVAST